MAKPILHSDEKINSILEGFIQYTETPEAKGHISVIKKEIKEVSDLMKTLSKLDKKGDEFTELVLYGLLPYGKSSKAKRLSTFPSFQDIKVFFKGLKRNYTDKEGNVLANMIYDLCYGFQNDPKKLNSLVKNFTEQKYSWRIQCGSITPILFCINQNYPVVNNRVIYTYWYIQEILGKDKNLAQKLADYPENVKKLKDMVESLGLDILKDNVYLDLFCFWYHEYILKQEVDKEESEDERVAKVKEEEKTMKDINYSDFIKNVDLGDLSKLRPHNLRNPERIKIRQLLDNCEKNKWVIPHFQRYFDWKKENIRGFIEAIFNDYYVGAFLLWDTDKNPAVGIQSVKGVSKSSTLRPDAIVLDGQQRITSLFYSIFAPNINDFEDRSLWKDTKIYRDHPIYFYIDFKNFLNGENEIIKTLNIKLEKEKTFSSMLFPLYELTNYNEWLFEFQQFVVEKSENPKKVLQIVEVIRKKLSHLLDGFEIPYINLPETMGIDQVTEIFEGINSTGIKLSVFDLLIARLYRYDIRLRDLWDKTLEKYPNIERYSRVIDKMPIYLLQAMSLFYEKNSSCKRKDILDIYENVYSKSERSFNEDWEDISKWMNSAITKLEEDFGIKDEKEIPFAPTIPIMTALIKVISEKDNKAECYKKVSKWYWSVIFTNAYSQSVDSLLTSDFKELKKWFDKNDETPKVIKNLQREISQLFLRDVASKSNAKYSGVMSLIALEGANDFDTGQKMNDFRDKNDKDHIFPRAHFGSHQNINSVLNMTWMSEETNRKVKRYDKPSEYIKEYIKKHGGEQELIKILKSHLVNKIAYELLRKDDFDGFLLEREREVLRKIAELVGIENINSILPIIQEEKLSVQDYIKIGESDTIEFKSSLRWDIAKKMYNKDLEKVILKTLSSFMNSRGGVLLIGVSDDGEILGLEQDFEQVKKKNADGFQQLIISLVNDYLEPEFTEYLDISFEKLENKEVCLIKVRPSAKQVFMKENQNKEFHIRSGNTSKRLDSKESHNYIKLHWGD